MDSNVAIDVLSYRMLFRTTWVRIPRANWCIMAEEACISESCGRHAVSCSVVRVVGLSSTLWDVSL